MFGNSTSGSLKIDPALSKLATGKLELEVKEAEKKPTEGEGRPVHRLGQGDQRAASGLGLPRRREAGLQPRRNGHARRPGSQRRQGRREASVRPAFFGLIPPEVTDAAGKSVPQPGPRPPGARVPAEATLAPGKEIELTAVKFELSPASASSNDVRVTTLFGMGKLGVRYKQVDGLSTTPDPILGKLATGNSSSTSTPRWRRVPLRAGELWGGQPAARE